MDPRYTKVPVTAGTTYYLWCGANTTLVDKITFTPSVTTTSPKYYSFGTPSASQAGSATYDKVMINITTAGGQVATGTKTLATSITLDADSEVAVAVTDVPSYVTINSVELQ